MLVKIVRTEKLHGRHFAKGTAVEVEPEIAERLLGLGVAERLGQEMKFNIGSDEQILVRNA